MLGKLRFWERFMTTRTDPPAEKYGIVRTLYDWMMRNAKGKHAWRALGVLTAALGTPVFVWLLARARRSWQ